VDWLKRVFGVGRLTGAPRDQSAGRVLAPASTQRTQLGLKEVDAPRGVAVTRDGAARCFLRVTGHAVQLSGPEEARRWLQGYARVLNTLPGNAVLITRSRPGGLATHIARQRAQTAALAEREPGGALARLSADQLAHARTLEQTGQTRQTDQYVALHSPKGDVPRLLAAAGACQRHLAAAGAGAELVTDRALLDHLAASWTPSVTESAVADFRWPPEGKVFGVLYYRPKAARVTDPEGAVPAPAPPHRAPRARISQVPPRRSLSQPPANGKVVPR
jgi:hypothetical protein